MAERAARPHDPRAAALERRRRRAEVTEPGPVVDAAAAYLAPRPRSSGETRAHLVALGYQPALVEVAIERLTALRYLDDAAFGKDWIASRDRSRPRSASALRRELRDRGLDDPLIDHLLAERDGDAGTAAEGGEGADIVAARHLLERKRRLLERELDPSRRKAKAWGILVRAGFGAEIAARLAGAIDTSSTAVDATNDEGDPSGRDGSDEPTDPGSTVRPATRWPARPSTALTRHRPLGRAGGPARRPPSR